MTKRIIPKVRFNGFDDEWQQKCLSEIFNISSGFTGDSSLNDGKYYLTRIETIADGDINIDKLGFSNIEPNEKFRLNKGDILYSNINSLKHMGKVALFKADKTVYHGINLLRLSCKPQYNAEFLFYQLNTEEKRDWARSHANQAVSQASINQTSLGKQKLSHPKLAEQSQIGALFSAVDSLLSSYKDNLENYQSFKKTMLSKMFPKAGQAVPEIRLDGFEGEWEQIKMGKIFTQQVDYIEPNENNELWSLTVEKGLTPKTDRYKRDFLVKKTDKFKRVKPNDFAYNPMNLTLGSLDANQLGKSISVSGYYVIMSIEDQSKYDIDYFKILLKTSFAIFQYKQYATGSLIEKQRVQFPTFSEIPFAIPSLPEQRAIGSFFSNLDELISSYQTKIDELETLKKKLLQDMFIPVVLVDKDT